MDKDGERITVRAPVGENLMEVAHANNVDLEGACEGSLACSTCHLIVDDKAMFAKLPVRAPPAPRSALRSAPVRRPGCLPPSRLVLEPSLASPRLASTRRRSRRTTRTTCSISRLD